MKIPWPYNPEDESEVPWEDPEEDYEEEEEEDFFSRWRLLQEEADWLSPFEESQEPNSPSLAGLYTDFVEIPAWQKAHQLATGVAKALRQTDQRLQQHPALVNLRGQSYLAAVDIAFGHEEGYDDEGLPIQLERCQHALGRIHDCLKLNDIFEELNIFTEKTRRELFNQLIEVRDALVHWMEELRQFATQ